MNLKINFHTGEGYSQSTIVSHLKRIKIGRTNFLIAIFLITLSATLNSCGKMDSNGKLEGQWQLTQWEDLNQGGAVVATNKNAIYLTVSLQMLTLRRLTTEEQQGVYYQATFHREGDMLILNKAYSRPDDDEVPLTELTPYFGTPADGRYRIEHLSSDHLVLSHAGARQHFRKY